MPNLIFDSPTEAILHTTSGDLLVTQLNVGGLVNLWWSDDQYLTPILNWLNINVTTKTSIEKWVVDIGQNKSDGRIPIYGNVLFLASAFTKDSPISDSPYVAWYGVTGLYYGGNNFNEFVAIKDINSIYNRIIIVSSNSYDTGGVISTGSYFPKLAGTNNNLNNDLSWVEWDYSGSLFPIIYRPTNCSFPGAPTEAAVGETVVVPVTFPDGYGLVNESNIYVTNNGIIIPSTYSNGQLTFTMPDPS